METPPERKIFKNLFAKDTHHVAPADVPGRPGGALAAAAPDAVGGAGGGGGGGARPVHAWGGGKVTNIHAYVLYIFNIMYIYFSLNSQNC